MMASSTENTEPMQDPQPQPGRRLRLARETRGMELSRVAAQLHLSTTMVHALEEENYAKLPARVFVRGYYKNYARIMGIPEETILQDFDKRCPDGECRDELRTVKRNVRSEVRSSHGLVRFITWAMVIGLIVLFAVWWQGTFDWGRGDIFGTEETTEPANEVPADLVRPLLPPLESQEAEDSPVMDAPAGEDQQAAPAEMPVQEIESNVTLEPASRIEPELPAVALSTPEPAAPVEAPAAKKGIVLEFSGPCWVDIRDSTRQYKVSRELRAGDSRVLGGTPPYRVVLGDYRAVKLSIDGEPYDLSIHADGKVARFTLDPATADRQ